MNQTSELNSTSEVKNSSPLIKEYVEHIKLYVGAPIVVFGIFSNILILLTLRSPRLKESPYIHLKALAFADLTALLFILTEVFFDNSPDYTWNFFRAYFYYPISNIAFSTGVWVVVTMSLERCLFLQFPLWAPIRCTVHSARVKVGVVFASNLLINTPRFVWHVIAPCPNKSHACCPGGGGNCYMLVGNPDLISVAVIISWIHSVLLNFLPLLLLILFNSFLVYKLRHQQKKRRKLGVRKNQHNTWTREQARLTLTCIVIVGLFLILVVPSAFGESVIITALTGLKHSLALAVFQRIANFLIWINLSINFLLYSFINVKFYNVWKRMMEQCLGRIRSGGAVCRNRDYLRPARSEHRKVTKRQSTGGTHSSNKDCIVSISFRKDTTSTSLRSN